MKRGTPSHCEAIRLSTAVLTHPARRSSFSRDRCPRKMIVARQSVYPSFKYDRYFSDLFSRAHSPPPSTGFSAYKAFPVPVTLYP